MKILQVIPYFNPKFGGDVNVCYNISKELKQLGNDVTILTTDYRYDDSYAKSIQDEGIKVIPIHCNANIGLFLISLDLKRWLKHTIKNFDIIHMHDFRSYQNNITYRYCKKYDIPYVLQPHASTPRMISKKGLKWFYDIIFGYNIIRNAKNVIAVSKEEATYDYSMGVTKENIKIIYNGIDIENFIRLPKKGDFISKFKLNGKIILYLGRINKSKGLDFAVDAFSHLIKEMNDITFVIAGGDDGYKTKLEKKIHKLGLTDHIRFTGFLNENEKLSAYVDSDVFLHTVMYMGGVGIAPFESILCDTPVIITKECGEIIKEINAGLIVEYGDIDQLKDSIKTIIKYPENGAKMIESGKNYILKNLTWNKIVKDLESVYYEVINTQRVIG